MNSTHGGDYKSVQPRNMMNTINLSRIDSPWMKVDRNALEMMKRNRPKIASKERKFVTLFFVHPNGLKTQEPNFFKSRVSYRPQARFLAVLSVPLEYISFFRFHFYLGPQPHLHEFRDVFFVVLLNLYSLRSLMNTFGRINSPLPVFRLLPFFKVLSVHHLRFE